VPDWSKVSLAAQIGANIAYPLACAAGCLFLLATCLRFSRNHIKILDNLSANAYAMYLVHYIFVVCLQYALLGSNLFPIAKVAIVLSCTQILNWASSTAFNRFALEPPALCQPRSDWAGAALTGFWEEWGTSCR
jgi:glucan biosynthesis protein C